MRAPLPRLSRKLIRHLLPLLLSALCACGGSGGGTASSGTSASQSSSRSSATSVASSASSSKTSSSSISASASSSTSASVSSSSSSASSGIYVAQPEVATCSPGQLKDSERTAVLNKLNAVRARHGLAAVSYDSSFDAGAAEAAMYMVANKGLTHTPSTGGLCYTSGASSLAGSSNLHLSWTSGSTTQNIASSDAVVGYLIDDNVSSLGHRRWVLYPFLTSTTYGRVDGQPTGTSNKYMASVLKVIGNTTSSVSMSNDFVAYPYGNYPSSEFSASWFLSFSVVASKTNVNANGSGQVSFASASISVTRPDSTSLTVSEQSADYTGYGLANNLQWKVSGLTTGVTYTVTISNVVVNGSTRNFSYTFTLQ